MTPAIIAAWGSVLATIIGGFVTAYVNIIRARAKYQPDQPQTRAAAQEAFIRAQARRVAWLTGAAALSVAATLGALVVTAHTVNMNTGRLDNMQEDVDRLECDLLLVRQAIVLIGSARGATPSTSPAPVVC